MNGKKVENFDFELNVGHYKSSQQRNQGAGLSTTGLFTKPFNNLFVKNFPHQNFSEEDLKTRFEKFGEILSIKVVSCDKNDTNLASQDSDQDSSEKAQSPVNGFGFVCFKNAQDARKALEFYHGQTEKQTPDSAETTEKGDDKNQVIDSKDVPEKLYVVPALKRELRDAIIRQRSLKFKKSMANKNLYFRGFPVESDQDVEKIEQDLKSWFSAFGKVQNVKLMLARGGIETEEGKKPKLLGYGFVCFSSVEHAQKAKQEAPKELFKGKTLYICQFETRE